MDLKPPGHQVHPHHEPNQHQPIHQPQPAQEKKDWYKQWWGIITLIFIWPVFLIWYAWKKSSWNQIAKIGATVLGVFFTFVYVAAATGPKSTTPVAKVPAHQTQSTATTKPTPKPVATPQPAKPLTTEDKLWQAVDASLKTRKDITISYDNSDPTDRVAFIAHTDPEPFDSQSFIRQSFTILALFGQQAFKIEGVDSINVQNRTNFTDQYGNKKLESGVTIDMHKADFEKFNWNNLKYQPIRPQIAAASDIFIILPALLPYTDDQLFLSLNYP